MVVCVECGGGVPCLVNELSKVRTIQSVSEYEQFAISYIRAGL